MEEQHSSEAGAGKDDIDIKLLRSELMGSVSILPATECREVTDGAPKRYCRIQSLAVLVVVLFVLGLISLIVGAVLLGMTPECEKKPRHEEMCQATAEGESSGLYTFLTKVQSSYFELYPSKIAYKRPVSVSEIREKYKSYDPSPENMKKVTDQTNGLLHELNSLKIDPMKLKLREAKAMAQAQHLLKYMFGNAYDSNYYAGDYMLGPNLWCGGQPICQVGHDMSQNLRYFKPNSTEELETFRDKLKEVSITFKRYVDNLKYGVKAGMVRTVEECKAGLNGLTTRYQKIAFMGEQGIYDEYYMKNILSAKFLSGMTDNKKVTNEWQLKHRKSVNQSFREYILNYVGKPISDVFRYLRNEHMRHCVPSTVSSGLASLPLSYIYENGSPDTNRPTTKRLPTGEALNGTRTYEMIVGFFTTNDFTPEQIYDLGVTMLNKLYPEVLEVARQVSGNNDNNTAKLLFIDKLNSSEMFYNTEAFPANESDANAHRLCSNVEDAKKFCPKRWSNMQKWFAQASAFNSLLDPKTVKMFHFGGPKYTVPNCPIGVYPEFNPSGGANYNSADRECTTSARYNIPFFKSKFGPKWEELSTCAHEGRPGHHTQVQGQIEHFQDSCGGVISWVDSVTHSSAFVEGWALYAENPLVAKETDVYDERPLDKYGMLKWQVWRALRLIVDVGLHYKGLSRDQALSLFDKYAWDKTEMAQKEVTRYMSAFGQATSYMIGQQHIEKLRAYAKKELGAKFNLKDFHFYLLSQGVAPLSHIQASIERYVSCTKDKNQSGCEYVLNKPKMKKAVKDEGVQGDVEYRHNPPRPMREKVYF